MEPLPSASRMLKIARSFLRIADSFMAASRVLQAEREARGLVAPANATSQALCQKSRRPSRSPALSLHSTFQKEDVFGMPQGYNVH